MSGRLRVVAWCALATALVACLPARADAADARRAILVFYAADPQDILVYPEDDSEPPTDSLLRFLGDNRSLRTGLWSSSQGTYQRQQALLDISQGTRQPPALYTDVDRDDDGEADDLRFDVERRAFANWQPFRESAREVSQTLRPGLLAGSVPGGAGAVVSDGAPRQAAIVAADERGRVTAVSLGPVGTLARRVRALARSRSLVVVSMPAGEAGRSQVSALARGRAASELLLIVQLPDTPLPGRFGEPPRRYLRQPAIAVGDGRRGSPRSGSTRRDGLIAATDIAPTILQWIGVEPPGPMRGQPIGTGATLTASRLDELRTRWTRIRDGRQTASFMGVVALTGVIFLLLGTFRGVEAAVRPALRVGALAALWWPSAVLLAAAVEPAARAGEVFLIAGLALALGAVSERLLPWSRAPIVPACVCLAGYTIDLALGGSLLTVSALGPSVASGGRFYGVSNELEPILPIVLLTGLAAVATGRELTRRIAILYAAAGFALLVVVGWGRLGADVGGAITIGAGMAAATLVMVPGGVTVRRLATAAAVPVASLALLIVIDLGLSGGSHLSRNLLRADDASELWELVMRRYELAWDILTRPNKAAYFLTCALAVAFAWRNRARLYGALPHRGWAAALIGGLCAGVAGALSNDSGPVLFVNAVIGLIALTAYLLGRPADSGSHRRT